MYERDILLSVFAVFGVSSLRTENIFGGYNGSFESFHKSRSLPTKWNASSPMRRRLSGSPTYPLMEKNDVQPLLETQLEILRANETYCMRERFLCKYTPECSATKPTCLKKVFVTGCSGSGTHSVAGILNSIVTGGATHELPSKAKVPNLVSWPSRCLKDGDNTKRQSLQYKKFGFAKEHMKDPMVKWAEHQLNGACMYAKVLHIVRHPLSFLSSNLAFGQCVECWTLVEQLSVPPLSSATSSIRRAIKDNRVKGYAKTGGRTWAPRTKNLLLQSFMLYYVTWNRMVESVADHRFQIEDTDLRELCVKFSLANVVACRRKPIQKHESGGHGGEKDTITWDNLNEIDPYLSDETWILSKRYGYSREVPVRRIHSS